MTLQLTTDGAVYDNVANLSGDPAVEISATGVTFTNKSGWTIASGSTGPAIRLTSGGNIILNKADASINGLAPDQVAIEGSSGADTVDNSGTISGVTSLGAGNDLFILRNAGSTPTSVTVDMGTGDDKVQIIDTLGGKLYSATVLEGGDGVDTLELTGKFSVFSASGITGFEHLVINATSVSALNLIGLSGFQSITMSGVGFVQLFQSANPAVDLAMQGGALSVVGGSTLHSVTGSGQAEGLELGFLDTPMAPILSSINLGGGDDALTLTTWDATQYVPTLPSVVDGGSGYDTLRFSVQSGETFDLAQVTGFEAINTGTYTSANSSIRLTHLDPFLDVWGDELGTLTIADSNAPNAAVRTQGLGTLVLESTATIGRIGYPTGQPGSITDFESQQESVANQGLTVVNNGHVLGEVQLYWGDDFYDGRNGTVGGTIHGYAGNDTLYGGAGAETIEGGYGADILNGFGGNDIINGGGGSDQLTGGAGADTFLFALRNLGDDVITDFSVGDKIDLSAIGIPDFDTLGLFMDQVGSDTVITLGYASLSETITLQGVALASLSESDFVFNLSTLDRFVEGTAGNDVLFGGLGNDSLLGAAGIDYLLGGSGNDALDGGQGADLLIGGSGNDHYTVDGQGDVILEEFAGGYDSVFSTASFYLYANVEELTLGVGAGDIFGVGNDLDNKITGNEGANLIIGGSGDDELHGGAGNDALFGEAGNNTLFGDDGIDYLVGGTGDDVLRGGNGADAIYGQEGDDYLVGGDSFDTDILVGGAGDDVLVGISTQVDPDYDLMDGGDGNDIYYVDTGDDLTFEAAGGGIDMVYADVKVPNAGVYLWANVENLELLGTTAFGVGNELDNQLTGSASGNWLLGGAGNDTINGGAGNDVLFGQEGSDTFVFEHGTGGDVIGDFQIGVDQIELVGIYSSFEQVQAAFHQVGNIGAIDLGGGDLIVLHNIILSQLTASDFILA